METVLIAGGEFGGLTTAIALRHQGIDAPVAPSLITQHIVTAPSTYELIGRIRFNLPTDVGML